VQPLTERQDMILQFIRRSIRDRGYPPTLREIGAQMGIRSTNGVSDHLRALERKGYLRREDMKSRALRPVEGDDVAIDVGGAARSTIEIPLLGRVAAGPLSLTSDACDGHISMDAGLLRGTGEAFALKIKGDSMIEAGIHDGDTIFVRRCATADRGEIVVARVGEEATVKRYFPEKDHIRLQPENKRLSPILVSRREATNAGFEILGIVVGLFRSVAANRYA
jgi:repressor LexA